MNDPDATLSDWGTDRARRLLANFPYDDPQVRLRERVKELRCLYEVLALTSDKAARPEAICARVIDVLLQSFLYESRTVACIRLDEREVRSANWRPPDMVLERVITCDGEAVGMVSVGYVDVGSAGIAFLPEEADLMAAVAANLSKMAEDRAMIERVRQAERATTIARMIGSLAHDFNNLLTVIVGSAETLQAQLAPDDANRAEARLISEAAELGAKITAQLLAYSRRQPLEPRAIATAALLHDLEPLLVHALGSGIAFELDVPRDVWPTCADPSQLKNALLNLAVNARDAMAGRGQFRIAAQNRRLDSPDLTAGDYVCFEVSDTGSGMADDVAARVFEPFFTTKEGRGHGLGLSSVAGFVHQSHGRIELDSVLGAGTRFSLCLPRSAAPPPQKTAAPAPAPPSADGARILVVEDEPLVRRHLSGVLTRLGYAVTALATLDEALAVLERDRSFDLLFSDVMLSGGASGIDLAARARALQPGLGVLLTSGFSEEAIDHADFPFTFISKPYRLAEIADKVALALGPQGGHEKGRAS